MEKYEKNNHYRLPGCGKKHFCAKLRENLKLPLYYLDMIRHKPDKTNISRDEFESRLQEILGRDEWIIDGNYGRTLERRIQAADTVFLPDYPLDVCLAGAVERVGKTREETDRFLETIFEKV